jgi:outer membrane lipoprotein SlyB
MKHAILAFTLATATLAVHPAGIAATGKTRSDPPKVVNGVTLAKLCDGCAVVSSTHAVTRKGKASGAGAVGGAVVGGVVGNQLGGGSGKTALTVLGAVGGGVAGNEIEKNMKKVTVWVTTVTFKDGTQKTYEQKSHPGLKPGDVVRIENGHPVKPSH